MRKLILVQLLSRRFASHDVRVRFAPSPTGYLHLGGLRTALYNYLFAKSNNENGKFILRIEDTDQTRLVPDAAKTLEEDLSWSGIHIDEGPSIGGPYGPYVQSKRLHIYEEHANVLLKTGKAYHCFCTEKRLDLIRREALRLREVPKYDNKCRDLPENLVRQRLEQGEKHCIRFKLTPDCDSFVDLIYGQFTYDSTKHEGDPIIMKADGYPTYHFANVVDDHHMRVTHVLRGTEWLISTTKHLLIYKAFKWVPPQFAHLPLLINADGTKLSKRRDGDRIRISRYRDDGIFPLALVNYITSCGGGFDKDLNGAIDAKIYRLNELAQQFNLKDINVRPGKLEPLRLEEYNRLELERQLLDDDGSQKILKTLKTLIAERFVGDPQICVKDLNDDYLLKILRWSTTRITRLSDLFERDFRFLWKNTEQIDADKLNDDEIHAIETIVGMLAAPDVACEKDKIVAKLKSLCKEKTLRIKYRDLMKLLRRILSGLEEGPQIGEMIEILGKDRTLEQLESVLSRLNTRADGSTSI